MRIPQTREKKMTYKSIEFVHIGVKLLYDHGGTTDQDVTQ